MVSAGSVHTCAIDASGRLHCFGDNRYGQCNVPAELGFATMVSAGSVHTCAIDASGHMRCFRSNCVDVARSGYAHNIIQEVLHSESAAVIDPSEAAELVQEQQVSWLTHNLEARVDTLLVDRADMFFEPVHLLRLSRHPQQLEHQLRNARELEPVRAQLNAAGKNWILPSGATIFVYAEQYESVRQTLSMQPLRPYHVIVTQSFYPLVLETIAPLRARRHGNVHPSQDNTIAYASLCGDVFVVENTFLDDPRSVRHAQSVIQSTAEAHGVRNPRRRA